MKKRGKRRSLEGSDGGQDGHSGQEAGLDGGGGGRGSLGGVVGDVQAGGGLGEEGRAGHVANRGDVVDELAEDGGVGGTRPAQGRQVGVASLGRAAVELLGVGLAVRAEQGRLELGRGQGRVGHVVVDGQALVRGRDASRDGVLGGAALVLAVEAVVGVGQQGDVGIRGGARGGVSRDGGDGGNESKELGHFDKIKA